MNKDSLKFNTEIDKLLKQYTVLYNIIGTHNNNIQYMHDGYTEWYELPHMHSKVKSN